MYKTARNNKIYTEYMRQQLEKLRGANTEEGHDTQDTKIIFGPSTKCYEKLINKSDIKANGYVLGPDIGLLKDKTTTANS